MYEKKRIKFIVLILVAICFLFKLLQKRIDKYRALADKNNNVFRMMNRWLQIRQEGKTVADYLNNIGCGKVAIYGMGLAGERLLDELRETDILVSYGIDRSAHKLNGEIALYSLYDELSDVDAVIVTIPAYFDSIKTELEKKMDCMVISLEDILYEI